jgi:hypothetical protein
MMRKLLIAFTAFTSFSYSAARAQNVVGLTTGNQLISFNASSPNTVSAGIPITGLTPGQQIVGMDFRPNTGQLFALGYDASLLVANASVYTINYTTGVATIVGLPITLLLGTGNVGFDFNPTVDRIRVVASNGANYRLNPITGGIAFTDGTLAYAVGDANVAETPSIGTAAYTSSYIGATATTLYVLDDSLSTLVIQNPPNSGTLNTVNTIGLTINAADATADMDIYTDPVTNMDMAYIAANTTNAFDGFYSINLTTGATTAIGAIGTGNVSLKDIAVVIDRNTPALTGNLVYALTLNSTNLISFDSENPEYIRDMVAITGVTVGQTIVGMDFRPVNLQLYALGYNSTNGDFQVYVINPTTGVAAAVGPVGTMALGTGNVGFDFNPTVDRIRVVASNGANYRLDPVLGTIAGTDGNLAYAVGDVAAAFTPNVSGVAYLNSYVGAGSTSLFGIDDSLGSLVTLPNPNSGVLNTTDIGVYTFNMADMTTDIDFFFDSTMGGSNVGYIAANTGTSSFDNFYEMVVIGNPVLVGGIGQGIGVRDIAAQLTYTGTIGLGMELSASTVNANNKAISIYPNPATNMIQVSVPATVASKNVVITDMTGKILIDQTINNEAISVGALPAGMYIILVSADGVKYAPAKFTKM